MGGGFVAGNAKQSEMRFTMCPAWRRTCECGSVFATRRALKNHTRKMRRLGHPGHSF